MMMIGVYMNAQLALMLPDKKDGYNIPQEEIGMTTSNLTIYSLPCGLITTLFISYAFELLGRKLTISLSYVATAIAFFLIPYSRPDFWLLAVLRCVIGVTMAAPLAHPLINDYVRKNSRGKAIAVNGLGQVFGDVLAMAVLLNLSRTMSYDAAFAMTSAIIFGWALFFYIFVKDPSLERIAERMDRRRDSVKVDLKGLGRQSTFKELTLYDKVGELTALMRKHL